MSTGTRFEWAAQAGPRDMLRCTLCGCLVLGNLTGTQDPVDRDELLHARWHGELEGKIKDAWPDPRLVGPNYGLRL